MIVLLLISLIIISILALNRFEKDYTSPTIIFLSGFIVASYMAFLYRNEWKLGLHVETYLFITVGSLLFYVTELLYRKKQRKTFNYYKTSNNVLTIKNNRLLLFFIFQLLVYYLVYKAKVSMVGFATTSLEAVGYINEEAKLSGSTYKMPWYLSILNSICIASGYIYSILFPLIVVKLRKHKLKKWLVGINLVCCILGTFLTGGRMNLLLLLVPTICCFIIFSRNKIRTINLKYVIIVVGLMFLFSSFFSVLGSIMGRSERDDGFGTPQYIFAMYCGAQIKNLDDALTNPSNTSMLRTTNKRVGEFTLRNAYQELEKRFQIKKDYKVFNEFNNVKGYPLGNVYTTFYAFYLDFQYFGLIYVIIISLLINILYKRLCEKNQSSCVSISLSMVLYAYFVGRVFLLFFSNVFYEGIQIESLIRYIICFYIVLYFISGMSIKSFIK